MQDFAQPCCDIIFPESAGMRHALKVLACNAAQNIIPPRALGYSLSLKVLEAL